jgi:diguanylate cyclase (GGDEF)-like protein
VSNAERCTTILPAHPGRVVVTERPAPKQPRPRTGGQWLLIPVVTAVLAAVSAFCAPRHAQWLAVVGGLAAVVAAAWPVLTQRRIAGGARSRHPLALISSGLWLTVLGEMLHAAGAGYPSYADALELAAYPVIILGLLRLVRARLSERPLDTLLVAAIVPTAFGAFAWMPLVSALTRWVPGAHKAAWMTVAFLVVDALALAMLARLTVMFRGRPLSYQLLLAAFGALLGAHVSRAAATITSVMPAPFGSQTLMLAAFGLIAAAALHPSLLPAAARMRPRPAPIGRWHIALLAVAVIVVPIVVMVQYADAGSWVAYAVGAPALVSLLAIAHLGRLVRERGRLEHDSTHDLLTALPNRARFHEELVRALLCGGTPKFAVGFVDLDRFKKVNDSLGHDAGDELLRQVSRRLQDRVRTGDIVARLAGDEFGVLLHDVDSDETALSVARRLLDGFLAEFDIFGHEVFMTPSVGLALAPRDGEDAETLLKNADLAMYEAKRRGRNTVEVYSSALGADSQQQLAVETRLHTGIDAGEMVVHYQPKVSLHTGQITGVEALVRWQHPTIGLVPPGAFMDLAEETGLVASIGEQVLHQACRQVQDWRRTGFPELTVSVNLSIRQFQLHDVGAVVADALESSGLPAHALELELTESAELGHAELVGDVLESLRTLGVRCSIDDFGTGYTGIAYLNDLPVDKIKLDKTFIDSIKDGSDAPFVRAMIAMAHSLGLEVIAEGVETPQQAIFLRAQGCDTMQGFLFSQPLPADELHGLLSSLDTDDEYAVVFPMPGIEALSVGYGEATDARALGDLLWGEQQVPSGLRLVDAAAQDDEVYPGGMARRTLVLTSAAGVMAVPLFLGLGSAGALPPHLQHAVAAAFDRVGVTPASPAHGSGVEASAAYTGIHVAAHPTVPARAAQVVQATPGHQHHARRAHPTAPATHGKHANKGHQGAAGTGNGSAGQPPASGQGTVGSTTGGTGTASGGTGAATQPSGRPTQPTGKPTPTKTHSPKPAPTKTGNGGGTNPNAGGPGGGTNPNAGGANAGGGGTNPNSGGGNAGGNVGGTNPNAGGGNASGNGGGTNPNAGGGNAGGNGGNATPTPTPTPTPTVTPTP